jgi:two-component system response regulator RegX3
MTANQILIIEDDPAAAEAISLKVETAGFSPIVAPTGEAGLKEFERGEPTLIILDLMLPDADGVEICRTIRQKSNVPIIMLTAKAEEASRIVGLELGADDYVTKPFSPKELLSRIKAVLRRVSRAATSSDDEPRVCQAAGIVVDEDRHEVYLEGENVRLTPTEYKILALLMRNAGRVVSRATLVEEVWGYDGFSDNLLEIHVGNLRRKIEDNPRQPQRLTTVRSFGYKIADDAAKA